MAFFTEKETEDLLVQKTRNLKNLDGTNRPFTTTKVWWETYDYVVYTAPAFHPVFLMEQAMKGAEKYSISIEEAMYELVCGMADELEEARKR